MNTVECPECTSVNEPVKCVKCGKQLCEECAGLNEAVEWVCADGCES